jgi:hypothetical protein
MRLYCASRDIGAGRAEAFGQMTGIGEPMRLPHIIFAGIGLAGAFASSATAQPTDQFDLACTGQVAAEKVGTPNGGLAPLPLGTAPYITHLRVDLQAQVFCQDDCKGPEHIPLIGQDGIIFRSGGGLEAKFLSVDRGSGSFVFNWNEGWDKSPPFGPYVQKEATGQCTKAPFTSIPKNRF